MGYHFFIRSAFPLYVVESYFRVAESFTNCIQIVQDVQVPTERAVDPAQVPAIT